MIDTKMMIVVQLQYEGLHSWPQASGNVEYLKYPHRHIFFITCKKEVTTCDREIEIISLKNSILEWLLYQHLGNFEGMSCESIASDILKKFDLDYCLVLEDNENGAEIHKL